MSNFYLVFGVCGLLFGPAPEGARVHVPVFFKSITSRVMYSESIYKMSSNYSNKGSLIYLRVVAKESGGTGRRD